MNDEDMLRLQIANLERELREAEETLRDRFAIAAINAAITKAIHNFTIDGIADSYVTWEHIADSAYDAADAMMEARK